MSGKGDNGQAGGQTPVDDLMRYDLLVEQALRHVVRMALRRVARDGLPGGHHFYIAFDTTYPGVEISERLREQYPEEMTIVLQHQFWDLKVLSERFEVGLSFGGVPETLSIPFAAISGFFDPHVQFALQFRQMTAEEEALVGETAATVAPAEGPADAPAAKEGSTSGGGAEKVVSLDAFRKKT